MTAYIGTRTRTCRVGNVDWFVLDDVCGILKLAPAEADTLPIAELGTGPARDAHGYIHQVRIVSPDGARELLARSTTPEARAFQESHSG